ncbi:hypothetical protein CALVIDRAFT_160684 [Calocera viscosa TUFC12733]|uniref:Uncharacterized protein n=1 Tax=Calocera viscosa (strain TUFC12733) TaxID=1330018 RepID=A0A167LCM0_CALVF|nr:hypothetical protein CALVIDRAFT_160684 [Calocera viscosa TUFC12733]
MAIPARERGQHRREASELGERVPIECWNRVAEQSNSRSTSACSYGCEASSAHAMLLSFRGNPYGNGFAASRRCPTYTRRLPAACIRRTAVVQENVLAHRCESRLGLMCYWTAVCLVMRPRSDKSMIYFVRSRIYRPLDTVNIPIFQAIYITRLAENGVSTASSESAAGYSCRWPDRLGAEDSTTVLSDQTATVMPSEWTLLKIARAPRSSCNHAR